MEKPPEHTWLDLAAHDHLIDDQIIEADKYEAYMHFLHDTDEDVEPEDIQPTP